MYATVHGSYRQHLDLIQQIADMFRLAGITVICPPRLSVLSSNEEFVRFNQFEDDTNKTERGLLEQMSAIKDYGFAYFVNPDGQLGPSASYELSHASSIGLPIFLFRELKNLPVKISPHQIWQPYDLVSYLFEKKGLPCY